MEKLIKIARQPIVTQENETYAYELLFRDFEELPDKTAEDFIDNNHFASSRVISNTLNHFGIQSLVGDLPAFLNVDENFIMDDSILAIPADKVTLEILEHVKSTPELIERIIYLKTQGYRFALDDATLDQAFFDNFKEILGLIEILKLDISIITPNDLKEALPTLKEYSFKLLAEKVETKVEYQIYKALGCELFQGYFFAKPEIKEQATLDPESHALLKLINLLDDDNASQDQIVSEFEMAPKISLQLLKYLNSSDMELKASINSIKHAIGLLGKKPLKNWLLLISFSSGDSGKTSALFDLVRSRSIMMGKLAALMKKDAAFVSQASFVGLLSLIENIFKVPLEVILKELNLDHDTEQALLNRTGIYGKFLTLVENLENANMEESLPMMSECGFTPDEVQGVVIATYIATSPLRNR